MITNETISYLNELKENNNRPWFQENKNRYDLAKQNWEQFFLELQSELNTFDKIETYKIFRIYRDVRFSKDKTPYKSNLSGYFSREGASRRGSYYLSLEADGKCFIGGGFYGPNKEDLFRIRKEIELDGKSFSNIVENTKTKNILGELQGERLKTAPKGFPKDHEYLHLLQLKNFYFMKEFSKEVVTSNQFKKEVIKVFKGLNPFFDYMSSVLTTNLNGESII